MSDDSLEKDMAEAVALNLKRTSHLFALIPSPLHATTSELLQRAFENCFLKGQISARNNVLVMRNRREGENG